jgi:hypothetical protein
MQVQVQVDCGIRTVCCVQGDAERRAPALAAPAWILPLPCMLVPVLVLVLETVTALYVSPVLTSRPLLLARPAQACSMEMQALRACQNMHSTACMPASQPHRLSAPHLRGAKAPARAGLPHAQQLLAHGGLLAGCAWPWGQLAEGLLLVLLADEGLVGGEGRGGEGRGGEGCGCQCGLCGCQ